MTTDGEYRDLTGLNLALKRLLVAYVLVSAISLWSGTLEIDLLRRIKDGLSFTEAEAEASDSRQLWIGLLYFALYLTTAIFFLRWTYFASKNARYLSGADLRYSPGWSVGWYFIPVATLWKPYGALKETFKASHPDYSSDWQSAPRPAIMPLWWSLWIVGGITAQAALRFDFRALDLNDTIVASELYRFSNVIDIPLGIVAYVLVSRLTALQSEKHVRKGFVG